MPPAPGSISASSRTATADGRKNTTMATSHRSRLASPNWLAAVVSQRSPTMALMLNSTTSRNRMTRGSCWLTSWPGGVYPRRQPADARAKRRPARDVRRKILARGYAQRRDAQRRGIQQTGVTGAVWQTLAPCPHDVRRGGGEGERGVRRGKRAPAVPIRRRGGRIGRVEDPPATVGEHPE